VYLHYVFDLWVQWWRENHATGDVIVVRYADDAVVGFQHRSDAERFHRELEQRMEKFGLALHPDKTRLIEFGRFAVANRQRRGQGKPETFDFLGFTHICGKKRRTGGYIVKRKTSAKRMRTALKRIKQALYRWRHLPIPAQAAWLRRVVQGYLNYHAVPGNSEAITAFRLQVVRHWHKALRRRSQRHRLPWSRFGPLADRWIPRARILHAYPDDRFYAKHPR
jgi:hypothetical protein